MPDAAAWILDIAPTSRNQMDVAVKNSLPGVRTGIHADIEASDRGIGLLHSSPGCLQESIAGLPLLSAQTEVVGNVPLGDYQTVLGRDGVAVPDHVGEVVLIDDPLRRDRTKQTFAMAVPMHITFLTTEYFYCTGLALVHLGWG